MLIWVITEVQAVVFLSVAPSGAAGWEQALILKRRVAPSQQPGVEPFITAWTSRHSWLVNALSRELAIAATYPPFAVQAALAESHVARSRIIE